MQWRVFYHLSINKWGKQYINVFYYNINTYRCSIRYILTGPSYSIVLYAGGCEAGMRVMFTVKYLHITCLLLIILSKCRNYRLKYDLYIACWVIFKGDVFVELKLRICFKLYLFYDVKDYLSYLFFGSALISYSPQIMSKSLQ